MMKQDNDDEKSGKSRRGIYHDDENHKSLNPPLRRDVKNFPTDLTETDDITNDNEEEADIEASFVAGDSLELVEQAASGGEAMQSSRGQSGEDTNSVATPFEGVLVKSREEKVREELANNAVDAIDVRPDKPDERSTRRNVKLYLYCCIFLLLIGGGIVAAFLGTRDSSNGQEAEENGKIGDAIVSELPSILPSSVPTLKPSLAPSSLPSFLPSTSFAPSSERFGQVLFAIEYSFGESYFATFPLEDKLSPQYRAAEWLADQDIFVQYPLTLTSQIIEFSQRYAAVVLYYATGGEDSWINSCNFLSPVHVCEWNCPPVLGDGEENFAFGQPAGISACIDSGVDAFGLYATILSMPGTNMTGTIPSEIAFFFTLYALSLPLNNLSGPLPIELYSLQFLQLLWLPFNQISGTIAPDIGQLTGLQQFWMTNNLITGTIPSELGLVTNLINLNLANNYLNGTLAEEIGNLSNLGLFFISDNEMTGSVPESFYQMRNLRNLDMNNNSGFTWNLVDDFGDIYPTMEGMSLSGVKMNGTIPDSLSTMSNLNVLDLTYCELYGTIPASIVQLSNMNALSLHVNSLTGEIPSDFWNAPSLHTLDLSYNQLVGTLPSSLGNSSNMLIFNVASNLLTGTIPESYASWSNLVLFSAANNFLTGSLNFLCDAVPGVNSGADCFGEIVCDCCQLCCDPFDACDLPTP